MNLELVYSSGLSMDRIGEMYGIRRRASFNLNTMEIHEETDAEFRVRIYSFMTRASATETNRKLENEMAEIRKQFYGQGVHAVNYPSAPGKPGQILGERNGYPTWVDAPIGNRSLDSKYLPDSVRACQHSWKTYDSGFSVPYNYCSTCDVKQE